MKADFARSQTRIQFKYNSCVGSCNLEDKAEPKKGNLNTTLVSVHERKHKKEKVRYHNLNTTLVSVHAY